MIYLKEQFLIVIKKGQFKGYFATPSQYNEYKNTQVASSKVIRSSSSMNKIANDLGQKTFWKALKNIALSRAGETAGFLTLASPKVREAYEKAQTLTMGLIKTALSSRIEFTGGGNMNNQERQILNTFHGLKEKSEGTNIEGLELDNELNNLFKGRFDILVRTLQWEAANTGYINLISRGEGVDMSFEEYCRDELGMKGELLQNMKRIGADGQTSTIINLNPILPEQGK